MNLKIANAPCSWGVDFADAPTNPPWERVLDEIAQAGFDATELGPLGYLPTDPQKLRAELSQRRLNVIAGTLFRPFSVPSTLAETRDFAHRSCELLADIGAEYVVVIDALCDDRMATAGQSGRAARLDSNEWRSLIEAIREASEIARSYNITPVLHSHAGTHIEFGDEVERALEDLPEDLVKVCVDTGHLTYAGMNPAEWIRKLGSRLVFLHFKDINEQKLNLARSEQWTFFQAIAHGIFCPLGSGMVNFQAIGNALGDIKYSGWAVVEQDCDPRVAPNPLRDAGASLSFLKESGLAKLSLKDRARRVPIG
jgi:inosose dehydratase